MEHSEAILFGNIQQSRNLLHEHFNSTEESRLGGLSGRELCDQAGRGGAGRSGVEWSGVECIAVEWSVMWYNKVELTVNFLWGKRNESGWSLYRCTQSRLTSVMSTVCLRFYLSPLKLHRVMEYHQPHPVTKRLFTFSPFHSFSIAPLLYFPLPSSISFHLSSLSSCSIISGGEGGRGGEGEGEGEGGYSSARLVHLNIDVTVSGLDQSPHSRFVSLTDR